MVRFMRKKLLIKIICAALALLAALTLTELSLLALSAEKVETPITDAEYYDRAVIDGPEANQAWGTLGVAGYWALSCTWGLIASVAGGVKALQCLKDGLKPKYFKGSIYFENVREQGSNNLGPFFFLGENAEYYTPYHEAGHGLQNILMGPLYVAVVGISSEIWYQKFIRDYAGELASGTWPPDERRAAYDQNPIERWATSWGAKAYGLELPD